MKNSISLRPLKEKDAPLMLEWMKDSGVNRNFRFSAGQATIESVSEFISESQDMSVSANFAVVDESDEYLGTVSLKNIDHESKSAEYAIALRKKAQGKGCGYSSTLQILDHAFYALGLDRVYLNVLSDNEKAVKFYEKFGFVYEGEFLNHIFLRGEMHSLKWFRLLKSEYENIKRGKKMNTIDDVKMLEFPELGDSRGHLVVVEGAKNVPFEIKRIFYIYGSDADVVRGQHANRHSAFCLINVSGQSKVKVIDCRGDERVFDIDRPHTGLYIPKMIWKDMYDFSPDSVLLVLSDEHYDGSEYIRDYDDFLKEDK